jgi:hypothetical protein
VKPCRKCGKVLPLTEFSPDPRKTDGHVGQCRPCRAATRAAYYEKHREQEYVRFQEYYRTSPHKRAALKAAQLSPRGVARQTLHSAVRGGAVTKPTSCEECGLTALLHGHHEDYSKPLDVEWLCPACHGKRHRLGREAANG